MKKWLKALEAKASAPPKRMASALPSDFANPLCFQALVY
jgi:hypothetical protein